MGKRVLTKAAAVVLTAALLAVTALPAVAGGKDQTGCVKVRDKASGLTTISCPDGSWD